MLEPTSESSINRLLCHFFAACLYFSAILKLLYLWCVLCLPLRKPNVLLNIMDRCSLLVLVLLDCLTVGLIS
jgi:hypothetical protein